MKPTVKISISEAASPADIILYRLALQKLADKISLDNLLTLAEKADQPGINERIRQYKNLI